MKPQRSLEYRLCSQAWHVRTTLSVFDIKFLRLLREQVTQALVVNLHDADFDFVTPVGLAFFDDLSRQAG